MFYYLSIGHCEGDIIVFDYEAQYDQKCPSITRKEEGHSDFVFHPSRHYIIFLITRTIKKSLSYRFANKTNNMTNTHPYNTDSDQGSLGRFMDELLRQKAAQTGIHHRCRHQHYQEFTGGLQIISDNARTPTEHSTPSSPLLEKVILARRLSSTNSIGNITNNDSCCTSTIATIASPASTPGSATLATNSCTKISGDAFLLELSPSSTVLSSEVDDEDNNDSLVDGWDNQDNVGFRRDSGRSCSGSPCRCAQKTPSQLVFLRSKKTRILNPVLAPIATAAAAGGDGINVDVGDDRWKPLTPFFCRISMQPPQRRISDDRVIAVSELDESQCTAPSMDNRRTRLLALLEEATK